MSDLVEREIVREKMLKYGFTAPDMTVHEFIEDELPSVTRQTGEWILLDECANSGYYCSRCQKKLVKEGWSNTVKKIKFCPNCGAYMAEMESRE